MARKRGRKERVADAPFHNQLLQVVFIMMFLEMATSTTKPASDPRIDLRSSIIQPALIKRRIPSVCACVLCACV